MIEKIKRICLIESYNKKKTIKLKTIKKENKPEKSFLEMIEEQFTKEDK